VSKSRRGFPICNANAKITQKMPKHEIKKKKNSERVLAFQGPYFTHCYAL